MGPDAQTTAAMEKKYVRPYHHLVNFETLKLYEELWWGLEYWGYATKVFETLEGVPFKTLADVGCGDGKLTLELARRYPDRSFSGYDLSEHAILFAKAYGYDQRNLSFHCEDFSQAGRFDVVTLVETLEHIEDPQSFLRMLAEKTDTLILTVPTTVLPLGPAHYRHYDEQILAEHMRGSFHIEKVFYVHSINALSSICATLARTRRMPPPLRRFVFNIYTKFARNASPQTGTHLVALCRK